jgi:hypothetical protein
MMTLLRSLFTVSLFSLSRLAVHGQTTAIEAQVVRYEAALAPLIADYEGRANPLFASYGKVLQKNLGNAGLTQDEKNLLGREVYAASQKRLTPVAVAGMPKVIQPLRIKMEAALFPMWDFFQVKALALQKAHLDQLTVFENSMEKAGNADAVAAAQAAEKKALSGPPDSFQIPPRETKTGLVLKEGFSCIPDGPMVNNFLALVGQWSVGPTMRSMKEPPKVMTSEGTSFMRLVKRDGTGPEVNVDVDWLPVLGPLPLGKYTKCRYGIRVRCHEVTGRSAIVVFTQGLHLPFEQKRHPSEEDLVAKPTDRWQEITSGWLSFDQRANELIHFQFTLDWQQTHNGIFDVDDVFVEFR